MECMDWPSGWIHVTFNCGSSRCLLESISDLDNIMQTLSSSLKPHANGTRYGSERFLSYCLFTLVTSMPDTVKGKMVIVTVKDVSSYCNLEFLAVHI